MTISVRVSLELAEQLGRYCRETNRTKFRVVQEAVADYLVRAQSSRGRTLNGPATRASRGSTVFRAFQKAGMIGSGGVAYGAAPQADKQAVRAAALQRHAGKFG